MAETHDSDASPGPVRARRSQRSSLALLVLWQLFQGPKHVYGLQKLLREQGKDRVVNIRSRTSVYQVLERLLKLGLVEVYETARAEGYPERVVYAITDAGRETAREWLRELLREPGPEYPEFIAALSIMFGLDPADARTQLSERAEARAAELAVVESQLAGAYPNLPRLFLLEEEYRRAILSAEVDWLRAVIHDLDMGVLEWSEAWLQEIFMEFHPEDASGNPDDTES